MRIATTRPVSAYQFFSIRVRSELWVKGRSSPGQLNTSEGVTASIALASTGGGEGSFFHRSAVFAVSVPTFARRLKRDWRRSCRCRAGNEHNRSNRERRPDHSASVYHFVVPAWREPANSVDSVRQLSQYRTALSSLGVSPKSSTRPSSRRANRERKARSHNQPINQIPPRMSCSETVLATSTPEIPRRKQCKDTNT